MLNVNRTEHDPLCVRISAGGIRGTDKNYAVIRGTISEAKKVLREILADLDKVPDIDVGQGGLVINGAFLRPYQGEPIDFHLCRLERVTPDDFVSECCSCKRPVYLRDLSTAKQIICIECAPKVINDHR